MPIPQYEAGHVVDPLATFDLASLKDKSVVVTGGASGLGLAYVQAFAKAGAFVTFGDINAERGKEIVSELGSNVQFEKCDVTKWHEQVTMFKAAISNSPHKSCDIVVANAGISGPDQVFGFDDSEEPVEPDLKIMNINVMAPMYTAKLAMHYFNRQPESPDRDRCLIMKASLAGYLDLVGSPQYNTSKFGIRGFVNAMRRTSWMKGIRVNLIAPWFIATPIMSQQVVDHIAGTGVPFALAEDAAAAVVRVACDRAINGRSLGVVPRQWAEKGYMDLKHDDYAENDFMDDWQKNVLLVAHRTSVPNEYQ